MDRSLSGQTSIFRASSYEPGNRAGSVTGTNSVVCSYGKFQPGRPGWLKKHNQNGGTSTFTIRDCQNFGDTCNFSNKALSHTLEVEIHTRPKLYHFGRYLVKAKLFCRKCFVPVTGLECSHGKIFIPVTEISVAKTEISVTGPARPLIWTHQYFYKEKSGEARSRKPSQPGWPGSYEEAFNGVFFVFKSLLGIERQKKL